MTEPTFELARLSITRKFFLWYFRENPYVSADLAVEIEPARAYLARLDETAGGHVTLSHLVTAALARTYAEHPFANATVSGRDLLLHPHVGAAMAVHMPGQGPGPEVGIALVREAETLTLRQLAQAARGGVATERGESPRFSIRRAAYKLLDRTPHAAFVGALSALDRASRIPRIGRLMHRAMPLTVLVSNVGATLDLPQGSLVRGGQIALPGRLFSLGSLLGIFPIQDEVLAVDGRPQVRAVLPMSYVFDHRLFDGVAAGRILTRFVGILRDPAREFGEDGERPGPDRVAGASRRASRFRADRAASRSNGRGAGRAGGTP